MQCGNEIPAKVLVYEPFGFGNGRRRNAIGNVLYVGYGRLE